jgi:hypothetical protein
MARYYFDLRDGDEFIPDEQGTELRDIEAAQDEAARALGGLAWDAISNFNGVRSAQMAVEVRDGVGPVMRVRFLCEIDRKE